MSPCHQICCYLSLHCFSSPQSVRIITLLYPKNRITVTWICNFIQLLTLYFYCYHSFHKSSGVSCPWRLLFRISKPPLLDNPVKIDLGVHFKAAIVNHVIFFEKQQVQVIFLNLNPNLILFLLILSSINANRIIDHKTMGM